MRTRSLGAMPFADEAWPIATSAVDWTIARWVEAYYRVRRWSFDYDIVNVDNPGLSVSGSGSFYNLAYLGDGPPANEQYIRLLYRTLFEGGAPNAFLNVLINFKQQQRSSTNWSPFFAFDIVAGNTLSAPSQTGSSTASGVIGTVWGDSVGVYKNDLDTTTYTGHITIDPDLWWAYAKSDTSAPVWDTADGSQLLSPHQTDELISAT